MESIEVAAVEYADRLGRSDLEWLRSRSRLTTEVEANGVTLDEVLNTVENCMKWPEAGLLATNTPVSPAHGTAIFTDGVNDTALSLGYTEQPIDQIPAESWYVVLDGTC